MIKMINNQERIMQLKIGRLMLEIDKISLERDIYKAQMNKVDEKTIEELKEKLCLMEKSVKKANAWYTKWKAKEKKLLSEKKKLKIH